MVDIKELRYFTNRASKEIKMNTLTLHIFQPILEYRVVIWSPNYNNVIDLLQSAQNRCLRRNHATVLSVNTSIHRFV